MATVDDFSAHEIRDFRGWLLKTNSSDKLAHPKWRRLRLQWDNQSRQRYPMQTNDQVNARVQSTVKKVLEQLKRSRRICEIHPVAEEDHRVYDGCVLISLLASN